VLNTLTIQDIRIADNGRYSAVVIGGGWRIRKISFSPRVHLQQTVWWSVAAELTRAWGIP
jgi:hypothetical protein